jgi:glycosyltransferase involved in cell wall biosynthesis
MFNFSVLISVYYKEKPEYLKESLESIWDRQTLKPNEIVLVKDGPLTAELDAVIDVFMLKKPFKIICLKTNMGLGIALAQGVEVCSYDIIARMDSDDISYPDRFERQIEKIKEGYDIVSCWSNFFENTHENTIAIKRRPEKHEDIVNLAKTRSPVLHAGAIYRRNAVLSAGNYKNFRLVEDYHLWVRMIMNGAKFYNIQEPLYYVRTSHSQIKRRGGLRYLKIELKMLFDFYKIGFYSLYDLTKNILIRSIVRILPAFVRSFVLKKIWQN